MSFDNFKFHPQIKKGIAAAGYVTPTPIQVQAIPPVLQGQDVLGLAQTGTGKTAAFVLPILERMMDGPQHKLRALILSPTRELAEQTHTAIKTLARQTGLRSVTVYGGVSAGPQIKALRAGVEIVVACPGRLLDLMSQKVVDLRTVEVVVLDEADRMFDMGFMPDVRRILSALPAQRQTLLFSATMPEEIRSLTADILRKPVTIQVGDIRPAETVSHAVYATDTNSKHNMLLALLGQVDNGQALIFTRTKHRAKKLAQQLAKSGLATTSLQGNLTQSQRQAAMDSFRSGRARIMVATDIAARGIDVLGISHVINYDMPDTADAYTHRIGRTGRMTRHGAALSLVTQEDMPVIRTIERLLGQKLERRELEGFEVAPLKEGPAAVKYMYQSSKSRPIMAARRSTRSFRSAG